MQNSGTVTTAQPSRRHGRPARNDISNTAIYRLLSPAGKRGRDAMSGGEWWGGAGEVGTGSTLSFRNIASASSQPVCLPAKSTTPLKMAYESAWSWAEHP